MSPKNCWLYKDIVYPFIENMILMDNIGKGEGICFLSSNENRIQINVGKIENNSFDECKVEYPDLTFNGSKIVYPGNYSFDFGLFDDAYNDSDNIIDNISNKIYTKDFEVCVRHEHSLYLIMEGVLRNAIKHHTKQLTEGRKLHLNLTFKEGNTRKEEEDFYEVFIYPTIIDNKGSKNNLKAPLATIDNIKSRISDKVISINYDLQTQGYNGDLGIASLKTNAFILGKNEAATEQSLIDALEVVIFLNDDFEPSNPQIYLNEKDIIKTERYNNGHYEAKK